MKKAQTSAEVIVILSILLTISVLYLVVSGQLQSFVKESDGKSNVFFETYDIGVSKVELGNVTTVNLQNNFPYTIILKNVTGRINSQDVVFYNDSYILNPADRLVLTPSLNDFSCQENTDYSIYFTFIYSTTDVASENSLSPETPYVVTCN